MFLEYRYANCTVCLMLRSVAWKLLQFIFARRNGFTRKVCNSNCAVTHFRTIRECWKARIQDLNKVFFYTFIFIAISRENFSSIGNDQLCCAFKLHRNGVINAGLLFCKTFYCHPLKNFFLHRIFIVSFPSLTSLRISRKLLEEQKKKKQNFSHFFLFRVWVWHRKIYRLTFNEL